MSDQQPEKPSGMGGCETLGCVRFRREIICGTQSAILEHSGLQITSTSVDHADEWECEDCGRSFAERLTGKVEGNDV